MKTQVNNQTISLDLNKFNASFNTLDIATSVSLDQANRKYKALCKANAEDNDKMVELNNAIELVRIYLSITDFYSLVDYFKLESVSDFDKKTTYFKTHLFLTKKVIKSLRADMQLLRAASIAEAASKALDVLSYDNVLQLVFTALKKDANYMQLCNMVSANYANVGEFVSMYYKTIDIDTNAVLSEIKEIHKQGDTYYLVTRYEVKTSYNFGFVESILKSSLNNLHKTILNKDIKCKEVFAIDNKFTANSIKNTFKVAYNAELQAFEKTDKQACTLPLGSEFVCLNKDVKNFNF